MMAEQKLALAFDHELLAAEPRIRDQLHGRQQRLVAFKPQQP